MKAKELMIGDWIEEKIVGKRQWQLYDFKDYDDNWEKWISPIPLTADILDKMENRFPFSFGCCRGYDNHRDGFYIETPDGTCIYGLFYIHELQHALRLCGMSELADNLKV